ncbi:949_t:CDS:2 [Dentiscutata erythropus]|uniref:949_t:CDS:1 n=1 Tax=Dentiscutata erythropus TaxID=1348616 RepID=A0A9N9D2B9_9GLOM|nr:949_t:CDS:2 [Dentiscutata erythropus]
MSQSNLTAKERRHIVNRKYYDKNKEKILKKRPKVSEILSLQKQVLEVQRMRKYQKQLLSFIKECGLTPPPQEEIAIAPETSLELSNSSNAINNGLSNYQEEIAPGTSLEFSNNGLVLTCPSYVSNVMAKIDQDITSINYQEETVSCIKSGLIEIIEEAVNVTNMISPVFPIAALINNIFTFYENVRLNEKISKSTIDRIIKVFAEKVLQLRGIKPILNATSIRKRFAELMEEYDSCIRDLKFTMIVDDNILRDDLVDAVKATSRNHKLQQLDFQQKSRALVVASTN